jgi:hypothetical protein
VGAVDTARDVARAVLTIKVVADFTDVGARDEVDVTAGARLDAVREVAWAVVCVVARAADDDWRAVVREGVEGGDDGAREVCGSEDGARVDARVDGRVVEATVVGRVVELRVDPGRRGVVARGVVARGVVARGVVARGVVARGVVARGVVARVVEATVVGRVVEVRVDPGMRGVVARGVEAMRVVVRGDVGVAEDDARVEARVDCAVDTRVVGMVAVVVAFVVAFEVDLETTVVLAVVFVVPELVEAAIRTMTSARMQYEIINHGRGHTCRCGFGERPLADERGNTGTGADAPSSGRLHVRKWPVLMLPRQHSPQKERLRVHRSPGTSRRSTEKRRCAAPATT